MIIQNFGPGTVIDGKYRILSHLGEGGIGDVWLAEHLRVGRKVAIKLLKEGDDEKTRARFEREAQALGRLTHPNVLAIYEFGFLDVGGIAYLVTEYLDGQPLSDWRGNQIVLADLIAICKQAASAISYAHHKGVLHRDLKPENIFLVQNAQGETIVKVLDFGMAKLAGDADDQPKLTKTGEIFGTPAYMSPEQVRGTKGVGPESDLYSLGVIMYELIEGRLPFWDDTSFDLLMKVVTANAPPIQRTVPPALEDLVMSMLDKDPAKRPPSAQAVWQLLDQLSIESDPSINFVVSESPEKTLSQIPEAHAVDPLDHATTLENDAEVATPADVDASTVDRVPGVRAGMPTAPNAGMQARPGNRTRLAVVAVGIAVVVLLTLVVSITLTMGDGEDAGATPVSTDDASPSSGTAEHVATAERGAETEPDESDDDADTARLGVAESGREPTRDEEEGREEVMEPRRARDETRQAASKKKKKKKRKDAVKPPKKEDDEEAGGLGLGLDITVSETKD